MVYKIEKDSRKGFFFLEGNSIWGYLNHRLLIGNKKNLLVQITPNHFETFEFKGGKLRTEDNSIKITAVPNEEPEPKEILEVASSLYNQLAPEVQGELRGKLGW